VGLADNLQLDRGAVSSQVSVALQINRELYFWPPIHLRDLYNVRANKPTNGALSRRGWRRSKLFLVRLWKKRKPTLLRRITQGQRIRANQIYCHRE